MKYHVEEIVCDYAVYDGDEMVLVLSSRRIADEVCRLLNEDYETNMRFNQSLVEP